jgi:aminoglycoside phosphotransferase
MAPHDYLSALPNAWRRSLRRYRIEPVERGMSDASLFRLRDRAGSELYLKMIRGAGLSDLRAEVERTKWLAEHNVRVPQFLRVFDNDSLSAGLMTALPGRHPQDRGTPLPELMDHLAKGLSGFHSLPTSDCPFDETVRTRLERARDLIQSGLIDPEHFSERNQGQAAQTIYGRLMRNIPQGEDLVVVHGDATFDNLLMGDDGAVGFLDCGHAGRGDRYLDLSTIIADIDDYFGSIGVELFLMSYGKTRLDPEKLAFFDDLYELF